MRQGQQNRRGRGRSNRKGGQSPLTRSFESTGPDVKIRGTPSHIAEKYMSLARDATSSGDPVLAENYLQHAEHYNRIIMAVREQQISQGGGDLNGGIARQRPFNDIEGDDYGDDEGDDDFAPMHQSQHQQQSRHNDQPRMDGPRHDGGQRHDRFRDRNNGEHRNNGRGHDRGDRHDRMDRSDRGDRGDRGDRHDRGDRGDRADRPERMDRADRGDRMDRPERIERAERPQPRVRPMEPRPIEQVEGMGQQPPAELQPPPQPASRRGFSSQEHEQPEFLRRPVRRPRREAAAAAAAPEAVAPAADEAADQD
ncbi:DUF4167 domain-containing protein [Hyphomicrobium sulfonivorans]|nr:DUF4167 domain-containing protein [Hyphomicrobium sulfonivorans]